MTVRFMNLTDSRYAYLLGFLQADGHLECIQGKGKLKVELQLQDRVLLEKFQKLVPYYSSIRERTRDTNFKKGYQSAIWTVCALACRKKVAEAGMPVGKKSRRNGPPENASWADYFRGLIDGDGSVGFTGKGIPFVNLTTSSPLIVERYVSFLKPLIGYRKKASPNKRDGAYTPTVFGEDAVALSQLLYPPRCFALPRKSKKAREVAKWKRPSIMKRVVRRIWTPEQDQVVGSHTIAEAAGALGRTETSIRMRRWRLAQEARNQRTD